MSSLIATFMTAIFALSQLVCACPNSASGAAISGPEFAVHTHHSHTFQKQSPCDDDSDHCDKQSVAIAKSDTSPKVSPLADAASLDALFVATENWPADRVRAPPEAGLLDRLHRLRALTPVQLKVRFLN